MFSSSSANAALRHAATAGVTIFTVLGALGAVSHDDAVRLVDALHQVTGGLTTMVAILGPVAVVFIGKAAAAAASLRGQLKSVAAADQQGEIHIKGEILAPAAIANAVPSDKVVAK